MKLSEFISVLQQELKTRGDVNIWTWDELGGWEAPQIDTTEASEGDVVLACNHPPFSEDRPASSLAAALDDAAKAAEKLSRDLG